MTSWEYDALLANHAGHLELRSDPHGREQFRDIHKALALLGNRGWELAAVDRDDRGSTVYFFKRPVEQSG